MDPPASSSGTYQTDDSDDESAVTFRVSPRSGDGCHPFRPLAQHLADGDPFKITQEQYLAARNGKTHGTANPTIMEMPFWNYMIVGGHSAYSARALFENESDWFEDPNPVWCFSRFGATATKLPDGRYVLIAGEHEDSYDPDFCIYNDVVVIAAPQQSDPATISTSEVAIADLTPGMPFLRPTSPESITIYGYPVDVFPPTDFHTSTYFRDPISGKKFIFIIGGLGYIGSPSRDRTEVYRLDLSDFSIQRLETSGAKPARGIYNHEAWLVKGKEGTEDAIKIKTGGGRVFSLLINRLEWISHGSDPTWAPPITVGGLRSRASSAGSTGDS